MATCKDYKNKKCRGKYWCGMCPKYDEDLKMTPKEEFAFMCMRIMYAKSQEMIKAGKIDKSMSYESCIQIMQYVLQGIIKPEP